MVVGTVVIVTHNAADIILANLQSVFSSTIIDKLKVVVVDNISKDNTLRLVEEAFPKAQIIASSENGGFGAGNNLGIAASEGEWLMFLNPDAQVSRNTIQSMHEFLLRNPKVGIVGPKVISNDGRPFISFYAFAGLSLQFLSAIGLLKLLPLNRIQDKWQIVKQLPNKAVKVDRLLGAAIMVRKTALEQVKGFDENFFLYSEEEDLCYRITQNGWEVYFNPETSVQHIGGETTKQIAPLAIASVNLSRYLFVKKHYSTVSAEFVRLIWILTLSIRMFASPLLKLFVKRDLNMLGYWWAIRSLLSPVWFEQNIRPKRKMSAKL